MQAGLLTFLTATGGLPIHKIMRKVALMAGTVSFLRKIKDYSGGSVPDSHRIPYKVLGGHPHHHHLNDQFPG